MDIDKFLDQEMSGEGSSSSEPSAPVEISLQPKESKSFESEIKTILSNIREYIKEQKMELVEKTYTSLWTTLTNSDFAWEESLYKEIHEINGLLYKEYNPLLESFTRQVQVIRHMIRDGRRLVAENKIDQSLKLYHEVATMAQELVTVSYGEKKAIEREVLRLYRDIHERVGLQTIEKVRGLTKEALTLLSKLKPIINTGNISKAAELHHRILMLYNQIPFGFLGSKLQLGRELLESYKLIAIQLRIRDLRNELPILSQRMTSKDGAHIRPSARKPSPLHSTSHHITFTSKLSKDEPKQTPSTKPRTVQAPPSTTAAPAQPQPSAEKQLPPPPLQPIMPAPVPPQESTPSSDEPQTAKLAAIDSLEKIATNQEEKPSVKEEPKPKKQGSDPFEDLRNV